MHIAFMGFGEAAAAFARRGDVAFDVKTTMPASAEDKWRDFERAAVTGRSTARAALEGASAVLSLVTADQALAAARDYAPMLTSGALWFDMNSVSPGTKRAAGAAVEASGARYVDVAVMAPVHPARRSVPLCISGPHAEDAVGMLQDFGFSDVTMAGGRIGDAAAIKMIRSIIVKGVEALTAECMLAAHRAGVVDAILASLDASRADQPWADRADYNLARMMTHGLRRAAEMDEVANTLAELGVDAAMTRGIIVRQRRIGTLGGELSSDRDVDPPRGLSAKLVAIDLGSKEPLA